MDPNPTDPSQTNPQSEDSSKPEVPTVTMPETESVATGPVLPAQPPQPIAFEPTSSTPSTPTPPTPPIVSPQPATPPTENPNRVLVFGVVVIAVLILSTLGTFLYIQNRNLRSQTETLETIESQRQLSPTPSPTPSLMAEEASGGAFLDLPQVLAIARNESATAQLLMITADLSGGIQPSEATASAMQYWFRRGAGILEYFQIVINSGQAPSLLKPAFISPDDNIPDLIPFYNNQALGVDLYATNQFAWENVAQAKAGNNLPATIQGKYLRATPSTSQGTADPVNLWQITYKFDPALGLDDIVVQLDAVTKQVLYTNVTQASPSPTTTQ